MAYQTKLIDGYWRWDTADTFGELVEHLTTAKPGWKKPLAAKEASKLRLNFTGTYSWEDALKLARNGWKEGRSKLLSQLDAARFVQIGATVRAETLDVAGAYPLVPAAVAGDPMCMFAPGLEHAKTRPIFRFLVSFSVAAAVGKEAIINRGAAILSWIDRLENEGARCEVVFVGTTHMNDNKHQKTRRYTLSFTAKRADEPLEIDRMAFIIAHPSMVRRLFFVCCELHHDIEYFGGGYGYPADFAPPDLDMRHSIYFGCMKHGHAFTTIETAVAGVSAAIAKSQQLSDFSEGNIHA